MPVFHKTGHFKSGLKILKMDSQNMLGKNIKHCSSLKSHKNIGNNLKIGNQRILPFGSLWAQTSDNTKLYWY